MSDAITKEDLKELMTSRDTALSMSFENAIVKSVAPIQQSFNDALGEIKLLNQEVHKQGENITLLWTIHNNGELEKKQLAIEISGMKKDIETNNKDFNGLGRKIETATNELKVSDNRCDDLERKVSNIHVIYATVSVIFAVICALFNFIPKIK